MNNFAGFAYEEIALEYPKASSELYLKVSPELYLKVSPELYLKVSPELYLKASPEFSDYIFGRWWNKEEEIDVLGLDSS
ncbi:MAG: DUF234 domain-containing protein [Methanosarcina sp.]|nr:DUF234 domain-containing protein [Methanosarcina sp.]MDD3874761.1 DUF234 domain-containing protein [Methanosarcina sp.]MDD4521744.1 DUF234 domain-containing protein [Methanosarcina sp.]